MLEDTPMLSLGKYAKTATNQAMFGFGNPNFNQASEMLLFSFALSNKQFLTEQNIKDINTRIANIHL